MKYLAVIMAALCLSLASVPCCTFTDDCRDNGIHLDCNDTHNEPDDHSCAACSPFFTCNGCPGFILQSFDCKLVVTENPSPIKVSFYKANSYTALLKTLFRPPRVSAAFRV